MTEQYEQQKEWKYDKDNDYMLCRCPHCEGRLLIGMYQYFNPYRFCPYCGKRLAQGNIWGAGMRIYHWTLEQIECGRKYRPY